MARSAAAIALTCGVLAGCHSAPFGLARLNPYYDPDRTTYQTPAEQAEAIEQLARDAGKQGSAEAGETVERLVKMLAESPDPLIRQTALESIAQFKNPRSDQAMLAALADTDAHIRRTACRLLSNRGSEQASEALAKVAQGDPSFDVRLAAVESLGAIGASPQRLLPALEDPDPAMQLAGVEAMKKSTGRDLGRDVQAYVAVASGGQPPASPEQRTSVADRLPDWVPFF